MELFFFDIETTGEYPNFSTFEKSDKRGSDLFRNKYSKMDWQNKWETVEEAYIDNAGIISTFGKICCISFGFIDNSGNNQIKSFCGENEFEIVDNFNTLLKKIEAKNFSLSGYRICYFDIPWLLHKLHKYRIKPAEIILPYQKKPWEMRIVDMFDDWKGKFAWSPSFDEVCYELGVSSPKETMNGSLVHNKFWQNKIDEIRYYCESDVLACIEVSKKVYST